MSSNSFGHGVDHSHAVIIKLPKMSALEKVSFSVNILEGSVNIWGNATPHGYIARIIEFYSTDWIIKSPIFVPCKKRRKFRENQFHEITKFFLKINFTKFFVKIIFTKFLKKAIKVLKYLNDACCCLVKKIAVFLMKFFSLFFGF